ncbi:MAG: FliA/WhiG family RNA polymerase sigma factor [Pseudomonadota bacterium]
MQSVGHKISYYSTPRREMTIREREALIEEYAPFVKYIAGKMIMRVPPHISIDELMSAGALGLVDAINKFDPARDIQFKTYAEFRIKGAMLDELRGMDQVSRSIRKKMQVLEDAMSAAEAKAGRPAEDEEVAAVMGLDLEKYYELVADVQGYSVLSLDEFIRDASDNSESQESYKNQIRGDKTPLNYIDGMEIRRMISGALATLTINEQMVMSLYYYDELTLKEIGDVMDLTESRISQIHTKAVLKLKTKLQGYYN